MSDEAPDEVWVGVTVIPHANTAHVDAFETEEQANEYRDLADEKAAEADYPVWCNVAQTEVTPAGEAVNE